MQIIQKFLGPKPEKVADLFVQIEEAQFNLPDHWKVYLPNLRVFITDLSLSEFEKRFHISEEAKRVIIFTRCSSDEEIEKNLSVTEAYFFYRWSSIFLLNFPQFKTVLREQGKILRDLLLEVSLSGNSVVLADPADLFIMIFHSFLKGSKLPQNIVNFMKRVDFMVKQGNLVQ